MKPYTDNQGQRYWALGATICLLIVISSAALSSFSESPNLKSNDAAVLLESEAVLLRRTVSRNVLMTACPRSGLYPFRRVLLVPKVVVECERTKPVATLRLLLEIVRNGKAEDALCATAYAVALEDDRTWATCYAYYNAHSIDKVLEVSGRTERDDLIETVRKLLMKVEARFGSVESVR